MFNNFLTKSIFRRDPGWVMWGMSHQEIGSEMDLHVGVSKAPIIVSQIYLLVMPKFVAIPPLKITQEASTNPFSKVNHTGEDQLIPKTIIGARKISLASTNSTIAVPNISLAHSKVFKRDKVLTDESMWNLSAIVHLSGIDTSIYPYLSTYYDNYIHV